MLDRWHRSCNSVRFACYWQDKSLLVWCEAEIAHMRTDEKQVGGEILRDIKNISITILQTKKIVKQHLKLQKTLHISLSLVKTLRKASLYRAFRNDSQWSLAFLKPS
jgi:hypothetical protein